MKFIFITHFGTFDSKLFLTCNLCLNLSMKVCTSIYICTKSNIPSNFFQSLNLNYLQPLMVHYFMIMVMIMMFVGCNMFLH